MRCVITVLVAGLLAVSACQAAPEPPPGATPPGATPPVGVPPSGADELVFQWYERPGFAPPGAGFTLPLASLYGDGRVISGPATGAGGPSRSALPEATVRRLTPAGVRRVLQAAADAGLTRRTDFGQPQIADAPGTVVTVVVDGQRQVTTVNALSESTQGLTRDQGAARARLLSLGRSLADLDGWLGKEVVEGPVPYAYQQLGVFAVVQEPVPGGPQRTWPLGDLGTAGEPRTLGRCVIVSGADLARVQQEATDAVVSTQWRSGTTLFHLTFRPLLPDERDCGSLPPA